MVRAFLYHSQFYKARLTTKTYQSLYTDLYLYLVWLFLGSLALLNIPCLSHENKLVLDCLLHHDLLEEKPCLPSCLYLEISARCFLTPATSLSYLIIQGLNVSIPKALLLTLPQ